MPRQEVGARRRRNVSTVPCGDVAFLQSNEYRLRRAWGPCPAGGSGTGMRICELGWIWRSADRRTSCRGRLRTPSAPLAGMGDCGQSGGPCGRHFPDRL